MVNLKFPMMRRHFRPSNASPRRGAPAVSSPSNANAPSDSQTLIHSFDASINPSRPAKSSPLGSSNVGDLPLELLDRLRAFPLFQAAPESFLLSIGKALRPSIYQTSQEIIREGDDAKAMYWLVRGSVRVTSRDGESTYAELKPGAFFGEIGILMDIPRTASIVASVRSLVVRLNKEDLQQELPYYPDVELAIREEAVERLAITQRKKQERGSGKIDGSDMRPLVPPRKRSRDSTAGDVEMAEAGAFVDGAAVANKRRKSPSPSLAEIPVSSTISGPPLTVRRLLKELPLFANLPGDILHFLGMNARPVSYPPFTEILKQGSIGRDVYFIVKGEVEVLTETLEAGSDAKHQNGDPPQTGQGQLPRSRVRARLKAGQYFGEVTSLSLAPRRTATVRSVNAIECLLISGDVLDELWRKCGSDLRQQVESEAKRRLRAAKKDDDVIMSDAGVGGGVSTADDAGEGADGTWRKELPTVKFEEPLPQLQPTQAPQMGPIDPDPFFNAELDNMRSKSRRSSLAPPQPPADGQVSALTELPRTASPPSIFRLLSPSPLKPKTSPTASPSSPIRRTPTATRRPSLACIPPMLGQSRLPDSILIAIFQHLELLDLMRCRVGSMHWWHLLNTSQDLLHHLNLSLYNKHVTDDVLRDVVIPFVGSRPKEIDLSNCFHVSDEGFRALVDACGEGVRIWRMKSVWDVSAPTVLGLVDRAKGLEEIDLSNCRKVGDELLARVVGWVVSEKPAPPAPTTPAHPVNGKRQTQKRSQAAVSAQPSQREVQPAPGTVIGAAKLKRLTLSYCKHIQDRSMAHLAAHAASRLESLDLTRCTSITDAGFQHWGSAVFPRLRRLVLADCTYLSDRAIVGLVTGCRALQELDLSFCCALSDTATEVVALGLPALRVLSLAFCGSAVSDHSLRCIGLHLLELRRLSVRGCVRVTGIGVEGVVDGCRHLEAFDVSQCKNLKPWLDAGGVERVNGGGLGDGERSIRFETVTDGTWRVHDR